MNKIYFLILSISFLGCTFSGHKPQINLKAVKVSYAEEQLLRDKFNEIAPEYRFSDSVQNDCAYYKTKQYSVKICTGNERYSNTQKTNIVIISVTGKEELIIDTLNMEHPVYISSLNLSFDIFNKYLFIAWVSENTEKKIPSVIHIECFDIETGKKMFRHQVYEQRWGIMRLSIIFNPFTNSVLFAYNDFNESDSKYLFFGSLPFNELFALKPELKPVSILNQDHSEKRYPKFIRTDKNIFLYHTSGDTWELLSYRGQQGIGLSHIDKNNTPVDYKTISDRNTINNEILILNDTLYYQHVTGTNNGYFEIKKIAVKDI